MLGSAVHDFQVPHPASPCVIASFSLGTPVIRPLELGRKSTLATDGLLQVVHLGAAVWHSMCLLFDNAPFIIFPLQQRPERMEEKALLLYYPNLLDCWVCSSEICHQGCECSGENKGEPTSKSSKLSSFENHHHSLALTKH